MSGLVTVTFNPSLDTAVEADEVQPDRKIRCDNVHHHPGGGGINVARAVGRLGGDATALWMRGSVFGSLVGSLLDAEGVSHRPVPTRGETRQSFAVIERGSRRHHRFSTPGPDLQPDELEKLVSQLEMLSPTWLVVSGGLPPGVSPDHYAHLVETAARSGAKVLVDTHGPALRASLTTGAVLLAKPNYRELLDAAGVDDNDGTEPDVEVLARELIAATRTTAIVVSLGAAGVMLVTAEDAMRIAAPTVPIRSRIGAGDSLVGGLSWRLACGDQLDRAVRFGVAAGAAAVMTPGTELCRREDTERLFGAM